MFLFHIDIFCAFSLKSINISSGEAFFFFKVIYITHFSSFA